MAKGDKFYFDNFMVCTSIAKEAANYLVECLESYEPNKMEDMLEKMHEIEHRADEKKHEMNEVLRKAFVTPVDREDLDMLSHKVDDVTDMIEEVLQKFYINDIRSIQPAAIEFATKLVKSCELLCSLMEEFENFKRSKHIREMIVALNDAEEECDRLYLKTMRSLAKETKNIWTTIAWRDIYDTMESCADACEHVSECVGAVIMKNT